MSDADPDFAKLDALAETFDRDNRSDAEIEDFLRGVKLSGALIPGSPVDKLLDVLLPAIDKRDAPFVFQSPRGRRVHRYGVGITVLGGPRRWWCYERRQWRDINDTFRLGASSHADCRTFRAFKRHLRKHQAELAGCRVVWANRYPDQDISVIIPAVPDGPSV